MTMAAARKNFHSLADEDTPRSVTVPESWAGILMWALGRHGPIALFVVTSWLLYQDNKAQQAAVLEVTKAQIAISTQQVSINSQTVLQLSDLKNAFASLVEEARKAHSRQ